jgi:hypothetical protein
MQSIATRLAECGLTMHPDKSKTVYCKESNRTASYPNVYFTPLTSGFSASRRATNEPEEPDPHTMKS